MKRPRRQPGGQGDDTHGAWLCRRRQPGVQGDDTYGAWLCRRRQPGVQGDDTHGAWLCRRRYGKISDGYGKVKICTRERLSGRYLLPLWQNIGWMWDDMNMY